MENKLELLIKVAGEVRESLRAMSSDQVRSLTETMIEYHGGARRPFLEKGVSPTLDAYRGVIQAGLARVNDALKLHYHKNSHAYVICLGEEEHFPNPVGALELGTGNDCHAGTIFDIPAGTRHGFTVKRGGHFYFLTVQTPPIINGDDDDFHLAE